MEFTTIEERILESICTQAEKLANSYALPNSVSMQTLYRETLSIQLVALAGKLDVERAMVTYNKLKHVL